MKPINISLSLLKKFLKKAKLATFAGNKKPDKSSFMRTYYYQEGSWVYEDKYTGSIIDIGLEIIKYQNIPVWGMSYRGGMLKNFRTDELSKKTFIFLKTALKKIPDKTPFRGPSFYTDDYLIYKNKIKGNIKNFFGKDTIFFKKKQIYNRIYHGGILLEKSIKIIIDN